MRNESGSREVQLIKVALGGNRDALGNLLLQHYPAIETAVRREIAARWPTALRTAVTVEDAVQEVLVRAIRDIRKFEPRSDGSFAGWLVILARTEVMEIRRRQGREKRGARMRQAFQPDGDMGSSVLQLVEALAGPGNTPSGTAAIREAEAAIQVGIADLPASQRRAIRLHELEGKSIADTAEVLRRSPNAVRGLLHRARQSLRDMLGRSSRWFQDRSPPGHTND